MVKLVFEHFLCSPVDTSTNISCPESASVMSVAESTSSISGPEGASDNVNDIPVDDQDITKAIDNDENVS